MERKAQSKQAKASNSKQKQGKTQRVAQNSPESSQDSPQPAKARTDFELKLQLSSSKQQGG